MLIALSTRLLASAIRRNVLLTDESPLLYHAATLGFNYFDFGFVRRGLAGSVVYLLGPDRLLGTAVFYVLCAASVAAGAATVFLHLRLRAGAQWIYVLLFVALMLRWAEDPGRTDLAVAALLIGAALAVQAGRLVLACVCVGVSLSVHETGLVFGMSLLAALLFDNARWRQVPRRTAAKGLAVLASFVTLYLLLGLLPHADVPTMVSVVRSHFPTHEYVDWAIYFAVSGSRGVRTSICQNLGDPTYLLHLASGLFVVAIFIALLRHRGRPSLPALLLAAVPPFLFLSALANDLSRWMVLAALNVWLVAAVGEGDRGSADPDADDPRPGRWNVVRIVAALLMTPLVHPKTWPIDDPIFSPAPVIDHAVQALGGPSTPRFRAALARCDAGWRSVLERGRAVKPAR
ncbi:MAG: hypothetical protein ABI224_11250 [Acetobacteraceae bacterium]